MSTSGKRSFAPLIAVLLLLALFGQAVLSSRRMSLTTDEPMHIAMGYTSLASGDYRLLPAHIHPPLINEWAAWALLLQPERPDPHQVPGWDKGDLFKFSVQLLERLGPIEAVELATRVPIALLSLLLSALVYRWASDLFGARAGRLALFLYVLDPAIISNSHVNTTDISALALGLLATFAAWRATRRPSIRLIALSGLALGGSIAAKVSGLFFAPMLAGLVGVTLLRADWGKGEGKALSRIMASWAARLALIYVLAGGVVWAVYGFEFKPLPGGALPIPAPSHWLILQAFSQHVAEGHTAFLAGQVSQHGWWWYFPLAFVVKTPLPSLILLAAALISMIAWRPISWTDYAWLLAIPVIYFANAVISTIDIGYRHLLPVLPFMFVFIGGQIWGFRVQVSGFRFQVLRLTFYILLFWYAAGTLLTYPHYLAYFNELAGGPDGGWRYLADSNTDWGQALKELAAYQRAEGVKPVRLSVFTFIDPAMYGVDYEPLTPMQGGTPAVFPSRFNPPPGDYVISATTLQGIPLADPEMFDWFRKHEPAAKIGHVMFVYHLQASQPRTWLAQCTTPVAPLGAEQIAEGFGRSDLRLAYFDCSQSWLYPGGGQSPGWVVLPQDAAQDAARDAPVGNPRWLEGACLSYEQKRPGFTPPFRIYEGNCQLSMINYQSEGKRVYVAPSDMALAQALSTAPLDLPLNFEAGLTLLNYTLDRSTLRPGETVYLETTWRVERVPSRLLSLMAHVLGPEGQAAAVGDGLGVPIESWRAGDVFIQRHSLTLPQDTPPGTYLVQTGVYWLDDGKRWAVQDSRTSGDRVLLAPR
ncbi:MAG: glycosyltransferase family 39 protein [Thermoflexales bacterium]|nr:glycosyltransferase family 39 protein [Thermoflexales bacterium]